MGFNLVESATRTLTDNLVGQIGGLLGESEQRTRLGIAAAVPALLEGVVRSSETGTGMRRLERRLDHQSTSYADDFGQHLVFDHSRKLIETGGDLSRSLLGGGGDRVVQAVSNLTGMGAPTSSNLVSMLMPLIVGQLGKQRVVSKLDTLGLRSCLTQQLDYAEASLLPGMRGLFESNDNGLQPERSGIRLGDVVGATAVGAAAVATNGARRNGAGGTHVKPNSNMEIVSTGFTSRPGETKSVDEAVFANDKGEVSATSDADLVDQVYRCFENGEHVTGCNLMRRLGINEARAESLRDLLRRRGAMNPTSGRLVTRSAWDPSYRSPITNDSAGACVATNGQSTSLRERRDAELHSDGNTMQSVEPASDMARNSARESHARPKIHDSSPSWWPLLILAMLLGAALWILSQLMPGIGASAGDKDDVATEAVEENSQRLMTDRVGEKSAARVDVDGSEVVGATEVDGSISSENDVHNNRSVGQAIPRLFDELKQTLSAVEDVETANASLPRLESITARLRDIGEGATDWSSDLSSVVSGQVTDLIPTLNDSVQRVLGMGALKSIMEQPMMNLIEAVESLVVSN